MARARTNPWLVLLVLTTGFFMILLDTTIVNVAIPAMSTGLNTTLDQILWVLNAYILVYAVLLITAGRLGDLYGQRNLFAIGLFIFTVASALCGFAQDPTHLIAARVVTPRRYLATGLAASAQLGLPAAAAALGLAEQLLSPADAAAIVAAGCLTLIPATIGVQILARRTEAPAAVPVDG